MSVARSMYGWLALIPILMGLAPPALGFETINQIKASGQLRVAIHAADGGGSADNLRLLSGLASTLSAELRLHPVASYDGLQTALLRGEVDLIGEPQAINRALDDALAASVPIRHADLWLVGRLGQQRGRLGVRFAGDGWHRAVTGRDSLPGYQIEVVPAAWTPQQLLVEVARGGLDAAMVYDFDLAVPEVGAHGLRAVRRIDDRVALGWTLRAQDRVLISRVNRYLEEYRLTQDAVFAERADWPSIQARGRIRMVTVYRPETYFAWDGELIGFEYELAREFAARQGLQLDVILAADRQEVLARLNRGEADFAAALFDGSSQAGFQLVRPHLKSAVQVVARGGRFESVPDPAGLSIAVSDSGLLSAWVGASPQWLQDRSESELLSALEDGEFDLVLMDEHRLHLQSPRLRNIEILGDLPSAHSRHWIVRQDSPELGRVLDDHWRSAYGELHHGLMVRRYFGEAATDTVRRASAAFARDRALSPYDDLVRRYAGYYGFDWRLILAMIFQESRFDPTAVSRSGARGLMQVKDVAARQVGIDEDDLFDPRQGLHAGILYLDWLRDQFEPELDIVDRTLFSLAAYNGGLTHVRAARAQAARMGLDQRRWFGHVERALRVLATPEGDPDGRYLALDDEQVVSYVRRIKDRFGAYVRLTESFESVPRLRPPSAVAESTAQPAADRPLGIVVAPQQD